MLCLYGQGETLILNYSSKSDWVSGSLKMQVVVVAMMFHWGHGAAVRVSWCDGDMMLQ